MYGILFEFPGQFATVQDRHQYLILIRLSEMRRPVTSEEPQVDQIEPALITAQSNA